MSNIAAIDSSTKDASVAIIGLSVRFPGEASTTEGFWNVIERGGNTRIDIPSQRMSIAALQTSDFETSPTNGGHFMADDISAFDAPFFKITASEATAMDPQSRSLLEITYQALENAGITLKNTSGINASVYVGCASSDYSTLHSRDPLLGSRHTTTGLGHSFLANRLSWFYGFTGPSMTVDTACSSSLYALQLAYDGLSRCQSDMAIVAGSNLILDPALTMSLAGTNALSPRGLCQSFDAAADGFGRGEGYGVVVLKRAIDAILARDPIRAIIRTVASNQDGRTPFITQPSQKSQEALIKKAYLQAGLDFGETSYFEAHATGTPVGDPIETNAIVSVLDNSASKRSDIYMGSVKANIGHLEGCSGIASLVKVILMLEKRVIPPIAGLCFLNPDIKNSSFLKFPTVVEHWHDMYGSRRASINSFGLGGANCHAILEDASSFVSAFSTSLKGQQKSPDCYHQELSVTQYGEETKGDYLAKDREYLLFFSAADQSVLADMLKIFESSAYLENRTKKNPPALADLEYTLGIRRSWLTLRSFAVLRSVDQLQKLTELVSPSIRQAPGQDLIYIFTGQGSQWIGMGKQLLHFPTFRNSLNEAERYVLSLGAQWHLVKMLVNPATEQSVDDPELSQTLTTALQIALVELLHSFSLRPSAVVGHSSGEIAAAFAVGALSRTSSWRVAFHRGRLASRLSKDQRSTGSMLSVALSSKEAQRRISRLSIDPNCGIDLSIACINSPKSVTISGDKTLLDLLQPELEAESIFVKKLKVQVAYHSSHMRDIATEYEKSISALVAGYTTEEACDMTSSVTSAVVDHKTLRSPEYWVRNLLSPVSFASALESVSKRFMHPPILLEVGPHSSLRSSVHEIMSAQNQDYLYFSLLKRNISATCTVLQTLGHLRCLGVDFDLEKVIRGDEIDFSEVSVLTHLPSYPFDHSKTYWQEGPINKGYRLQKYPRSRLIGLRVPNWNDLEPRWMNLLKKDEIPWVQGHMINADVLLPGAAMLVMAIEAATQIVENRLTIDEFCLKDTCFLNPILFTNDNAVIEIQVSLRQYEMDTTQNRKTFKFAIDSAPDGIWTRNCEGTISLELSRSCNFISKFSSEEVTLRLYDRNLAHANKSSLTRISGQDMYSALRKLGFNYTTPFDRLDNITACRNYGALAELVLHDCEGYESTESVVNPVLLDCFLQMVLVTLTQAGQHSFAPAVITELKTMRLVNMANTTFEEGPAKLYAKLSEEPNSCDVIAWSQALRRAIFSVEKVRVTMVAAEASLGSLSLPSQDNSSMSYQRVWRPDVRRLHGQRLRNYCQRISEGYDDGPFDLVRSAQFVTLGFMQRTLAAIGSDDRNYSPHILKHVQWMRRKCEAFHKDTLPEVDSLWKHTIFDDSIFESQVHKVENSGAKGRLHIEAGRAQAEMINGKKNALEVLFSGTLANDYYYEGFRDALYMRTLPRYIDLLAHYQPGIRILEIGAGTGGLTGGLLAIIGGDELSGTAPRFSRYTFTDISQGFFAPAATRFKAYHARMEFRTLDIDNDPLEQGFQSHDYDLVFAGSVLHATRDLRATVRNIRKLLKPSGKLIMIEPTFSDKLTMGFCFGTVPGWWASTDGRADSPCITVEQWGQIFTECGFSGLDLVLPDYDSPLCQETTACVTTAITPDSLINGSKKKHQMRIMNTLHSNDNKAGVMLDDFFRELQCALVDEYELTSHQDFNEETLGSQSIIVVDCGPESVLAHMDGVHLERLQMILMSAPAVLWIKPTQTNTPETHGMADGLLRTIRNEREELRCINLSVDMTLPMKNRIDAAVSALEELQCHGGNGIETELRLTNDGIEIPRYMRYPEIDGILISSSQAMANKRMRFSDVVDAKVVVGTPGLLDSLCVTQQPSQTDTIARGEVRITVKMVGLNFKDVLASLGRVKSTQLGVEAVGVVQETSADVTTAKPGDRVMAICAGAFQTSITCAADHIVRIPTNLSFEEAATLPVAFITAHYGLCHLARLQPHESVLIHAAAGGTGQAALQIARHCNAEIFATVGSTEKREFLIDTYCIPPENIFYSRDQSFASELKIRGKAIDVVFSSLAGEMLLASWESLAPFGRFVDIGKRDIMQKHELPMDPFNENLSFHAVDIALLAQRRPQMLRHTFEQVLQLLHRESISPIQPMTIYKVSQIECAMREMQMGNTMGKLVIDMNDESQVDVRIPNQPQWRFEEYATYMVCGGFGGVGRAIVRWMAKRGCRHLVIITRSGPTREEAKTLLDEQKGAGVEVFAPKCDITDRSQLKGVLADIASRMPPLRGCIQSTIVLEDGFFFNMTLPKWKTCVDPKVTGARNLHELLPSDLCFLILLSSSSGAIGNEGQSNYAAGNTYQDSLAAYRSAGLGKKTFSINLTLMDGIDSSHIDPQTADKLRSAGKVSVLSNTKFEALLDRYFDPKSGVPNVIESQPILGIEPPANVKSKGLAVSHFLLEPAWSHLWQYEASSATAISDAAGQRFHLAEYSAKFDEAPSLKAAADVASELLIKKLARSLGMAEEDMDRRLPLFEYGMDSLLAVEVRNTISNTFKVNVPISELTREDTTFEKLGMDIARKRRTGV